MSRPRRTKPKPMRAEAAPIEDRCIHCGVPVDTKPFVVNGLGDVECDPCYRQVEGMRQRLRRERSE